MAFRDARTASVPLEAAPKGVGAPALIDALATCLQRAGGPDVSTDELSCVTSVAFKNYVYDPALNPFDDPDPFEREAELLGNYGVFEAFGYYTGYDAREFNGVRPEDLDDLVAFELAQGRPLVTAGVSGPIAPELVMGIEREGPTRLYTLWRAGAGAPARVDLANEASIQQGSFFMRNWIVVVRPGERPDWSASLGRLRLDVLRWAAGHLRAPKELLHETRRNYATGLAAYDAFSRFVSERLDDAGEPGLAFALEHLEALSIARASAAARLPAWADELTGFDDLRVDDLGALADTLRALAPHYADAAAQASRAHDALARGERGGALDALADAASHERLASGLLDRVAALAPRRF
jgi:hypothetical protein